MVIATADLEHGDITVHDVMPGVNTVRQSKSHAWPDPPELSRPPGSSLAPRHGHHGRPRLGGRRRRGGWSRVLGRRNAKPPDFDDDPDAAYDVDNDLRRDLDEQ